MDHWSWFGDCCTREFLVKLMAHLSPVWFEKLAIEWLAFVCCVWGQIKDHNIVIFFAIVSGLKWELWPSRSSKCGILATAFCTVSQKWKISWSIQPLSETTYLVPATSSFIQLGFNCFAVNMMKGGMIWPVALAHPITVIWPFWPEQQQRTFRWPFLATIALAICSFVHCFLLPGRLFSLAHEHYFLVYAIYVG